MEKKKQVSEVPTGFVYNPELNKYSDVVLFPEKMRRVKEILKDVPPPDALIKEEQI